MNVLKDIVNKERDITKMIRVSVFYHHLDLNDKPVVEYITTDYFDTFYEVQDFIDSFIVPDSGKFRFHVNSTAFVYKEVV